MDRLPLPSSADVAAFVLVWCLVALALIVTYKVVDLIATYIAGPEDVGQLPTDWVAEPTPYPGCLICEAISGYTHHGRRVAVLTAHQTGSHAGGPRW